MNRWLWLCPILVVLLIVTVLLYWGVSWVSTVLIALALVCPAIVIWGVLKIRKPLSDDVKMNLKNSAGKR
ncbi:hypothetical protein [Undibacterium sp.]|uniref:hypothetical protein n=1 Tax=Undibacterium sp. TaxID=1914977 RepID=UPI0025CD0BDE|nr:hypothetical protein [Undibacterium sp.]